MYAIKVVNISQRYSTLLQLSLLHFSLMCLTVLVFRAWVAPKLKQVERIKAKPVKAVALCYILWLALEQFTQC